MQVTNATILITGGTGALGYGLVRQLLPQNPAKIIIYSRNEAKQVAMSRTFEDSKLSFCIGDVRDKEALTKACESVDYVFHLAELKNVMICENQPDEAIKTNIVGTLNVIEAAVTHAVKKVIYWSSDKAAAPYSLYGLTKAIGEKLIVHANTLKTAGRFVCVRGGTIFESEQSMVRSIIDSSASTHQRSSEEQNTNRFFLPVKEAAKHFLKAASISKGGEVFLVVMPLYRTLDLFKMMAGTSSGRTAKPMEPESTQLQEGTNEILVSEYECSNTIIYDDELLIVLSEILPELKSIYTNYSTITDKSYSYRPTILSLEEIKSLFEKGRDDGNGTSTGH